MPLPLFPISGEIVSKARAEAGVGSNPISSALQDTNMYEVLQDIENEGVAYPTSVGVLGWPFMDTETIIQSIGSTSNTAIVAASATTFTLTSGTGWDSPAADSLGAGYIRNGTQMFDFFTYGARASGVLTGVTGIDIAHSALEECHKVYLLPSDFGYPRALYKASVYLKYFKSDAALRQVPAHPFYSIIRLASASNAGMFLVLPYKIGVFDWKLTYQKCAVEVEEAEDPTDVTMSLPRGHGRRFYIEKLKAYIYENMGEMEDSQTAEGKAKDHLEKLLDEYGFEDMSSDAPALVLSDW